ncbi:hypothetical protein [Endozoicomonas elysicola]|nr:hypothetical protein [Endozoicomonas elysicola]
MQLNKTLQEQNAALKETGQETADQLYQSHERHQAEIHDKDQAIAGLQQQSIQLKEQLTDARDQYSKCAENSIFLRKRSESAKSEVKKLSQELEQSIQIIDGYNDMITRSALRLKNLVAKAKQSQQAFQQLTAENSEAQRELGELRQNLNIVMKQLEKAQDQQTHLERQLDQKEATIRQNTQAEKALSLTLKQVKEAQQTSEQQFLRDKHNYQNELKSKDALIQEHKQQFMTLQTQLQRQTAKENAKTSKFSLLQSDLSAKAFEIEQLQKQHNDLKDGFEHQKSQYQAELNQLSETHQKLEQERNLALQLQAIAEKEVSELRPWLSELKRVQEDHKRLTLQLKEKEVVIAKMEGYQRKQVEKHQQAMRTLDDKHHRTETSLNEQLRTVRKAHEKSSTALTDAQEMNQALLSKTSVLEMKLRETESEKETNRSELHTKCEEITALNEQLALNANYHQTLQLTNEQFQQSLLEKEKTSQALQEALESARQQNQLITQQLNETESLFKPISEQIKALEAKISEADVTHQQLQQQKDQAIQQNTTAQQKVLELQSVLDSQNSKLQELQADQKQLTDHLALKTIEVEGMASTQKQLNKDHQQTVIELKTQHLEAEAVWGGQALLNQKALEEASTALTESQEQCKLEKQRVETLQKELSQTKATFSTLQDSVCQAREDNRTLRSTVESVEEAITEISVEKDNALKEVQLHLSEITGLTQTLAERTQSRQTLQLEHEQQLLNEKNTARTLQTALDTVRRQKEQLTDELREEKDKVRVISEQMNTYQAESNTTREKLQQQIAFAEQENASLQARLTQIKDQLAELQAKLANFELLSTQSAIPRRADSLDQMMSSSLEYKEEIQDLKHQLDEVNAALLALKREYDEFKYRLAQTKNKVTQDIRAETHDLEKLYDAKVTSMPPLSEQIPGLRKPASAHHSKVNTTIKSSPYEDQEADLQNEHALPDLTLTAKIELMSEDSEAVQKRHEETIASMAANIEKLHSMLDEEHEEKLCLQDILAGYVKANTSLKSDLVHKSETLDSLESQVMSLKGPDAVDSHWLSSETLSRAQSTSALDIFHLMPRAEQWKIHDGIKQGLKRELTARTAAKPDSDSHRPAAQELEFPMSVQESSFCTLPETAQSHTLCNFQPNSGGYAVAVPSLDLGSDAGSDAGSDKSILFEAFDTHGLEEEAPFFPYSSDQETHHTQEDVKPECFEELSLDLRVPYKHEQYAEPSTIAPEKSYGRSPLEFKTKRPQPSSTQFDFSYEDQECVFEDIR